LHMVVEAGAEEALQLVARQHDALQDRGQLLDGFDTGAAESQLMPHAARLSQQGVAHACFTFSAAASIMSARASTWASLSGGSWVRRSCVAARKASMAWAMRAGRSARPPKAFILRSAWAKASAFSISRRRPSSVTA